MHLRVRQCSGGLIEHEIGPCRAGLLSIAWEGMAEGMGLLSNLLHPIHTEAQARCKELRPLPPFSNDYDPNPCVDKHPVRRLPTALSSNRNGLLATDMA